MITFNPTNDFKNPIPLLGGVYGYDASVALNRYSSFVDGRVNDVIVAIGSIPPSDAARKAISASFERLGYGENRISWVSILGINDVEEGSLDASAVYEIVESLNPLAAVVLDAGAMSLFSQAYSVGLTADTMNRVACRSVAAFTSFENMLGSDDSKQKAWRVLKQLEFLD